MLVDTTGFTGLVLPSPPSELHPIGLVVLLLTYFGNEKVELDEKIGIIIQPLEFLTYVSLSVV